MLVCMICWWRCVGPFDRSLGHGEPWRDQHQTSAGGAQGSCKCG